MLDSLFDSIASLNRGFNLYFEKFVTLHWIFFGLGILLSVYGYLTGDLFELISSVVVALFCCPLKQLPKIPGMLRYCVIGLLITLQLVI
jgi:hypothetical protein